MILEAGQRLSRSRLWQLQRNYFAKQGLGAFSSATVPHYITCNAFIAEAYARVVLGWMRDRTRLGLDATQPLYLVELGAGSGRFAFLFLKKLESLLQRTPLDVRYVYVMTDFTDDHIARWRAHPQLQPLVATGRLDFARYDVERDQTLTLAESGVTLAPGTVRNPLAVIANYYFDSIPQDCFYVCEGELFQSLVTLTTPGDEADPDDPAVIDRLELSYEDVPFSGDYYGDADLDGVLAAERRHVKKGAVRLPTAGLAVLKLFSQIAGDRWLLVSGDKGYVHEDSLDARDRPGIAVHGSFSMDVNYHALGEFFRARGGRVHIMDHRHNSLNIVAMHMGAGEHPDTRAAFADAVESFGPDDYFVVRKAVEAHADELTLTDLLSLMRLGKNDPRMLRGLLPHLRKRGAKAPPAQRRELTRVVLRAWELHFHINEDHDLPFSVGVMLIELREAEAAIRLLETSWEWYGPDAGTAYNLALAHARLKRDDLARPWIARALEREPAHAAALKLLGDIEVRANPEPG
jgi:hypothetical protein